MINDQNFKFEDPSTMDFNLLKNPSDLKSESDSGKLSITD